MDRNMGRRTVLSLGIFEQIAAILIAAIMVGEGAVMDYEPGQLTPAMLALGKVC